VVPTLNAKKSITKQSALVYQHTSVVHQDADLNVSLVLNVRMTKLAQTKNVSIHVQTHVARMPNVELTITVRSAIAWMDTLEIHSLDAILNLVRLAPFHILTVISYCSSFSPSYTTSTRALPRSLQSLTLWAIFTMP
jgi:hypothetical protein